MSSLRGRPLLYTSYEDETRLFPTRAQRVALAIFLLIVVLMPFDLPVIDQLPVIRFLDENYWLKVVNKAMILAIGALGLNLLSGLAGQISLGHAFFMGVGAYTAVYLGGPSTARLWGHGLPVWVWLPAAGVMAALIGILVAPAAIRVRGLYLAVATLGLVFIGVHLSRVFPEIAGPASLGRKWPRLEFRLWKEEEPFLDLTRKGKWLWFEVNQHQKTYFFLLLLVILFAVLSANLTRTRTGRSWAAIRDRDVAAEVMGVPEFRSKTTAFAISSFYAGVAGALLASFSIQLNPESWDLLLSVEFLAILLIGGMGRVSGALAGTFFVVLTPHFVERFVHWMGDKAEGEGLVAGVADGLVSLETADFGIVSVSQTALGFPLPVAAVDDIIYGSLIIVFLLFEPLGLYGVWIKVRNYWKGWPFSY
ncbi:MAG: branched-chain amino acid ABC transporter permease [Acidimicrobiaceae bacterium]|nr:branched-chain amino acid ABC transporter permease [Acidimicrobiaceae bacterium]|tara:strand:- start:189 stop:1451 length:1263 start_codon:yes stop_codon:yes gene_type:complete